eukprot:TRINITY_DN27909_c0_g1_i1.p1 TRINITY_DN27909_c0_g1~~TRINITY_DN27909_c0_g1_i1.p1  ORF type:complete len:491 (-),score=33.51 TRINITY_DN27909_c0_g1_i1:123-1595(-)
MPKKLGQSQLLSSTMCQMSQTRVKSSFLRTSVPSCWCAMRHDDGLQMVDKDITLGTTPEIAGTYVQIQEMHEFLKRTLRRLMGHGFILVAFGPIVFFLTCFGLMPNVLFLIVMALLLVWGARVQRTFIASLEDFLRDAGHYPHLVNSLTNMKNGHRLLGTIPVFIPVWLWKLATTITEVVDPSLDGNQVGRAFNMKPEKNEIFKQSWTHICSADGWFHFLCPSYWGLAWTLFFIYAFTFTIPLGIPILLGTNCVFKAPLVDLRFSEQQSPALRFAALRRYWWIAMAGVASACGMPLFAFAFQKLAQSECSELGSGEWGFFDFITFLTRIVFEACPMLWFQISLLGLSWDDSSAATNVIALLSVFTSCKCIAETTGGMLYELWSGMAPRAYEGEWMGFLKGQLHEDMEDEEINRRTVSLQQVARGQTLLCVNFGYISGVIMVAIQLAALLRLWGVMACDSHILNLGSLQIGDPLAGCFEYNSTNANHSDDH